MFRKVISCFLALAFLLACCGFSLADSGIEYDEDGGVWNFDTGVYTAPDGKTYAIENDDYDVFYTNKSVHNYNYIIPWAIKTLGKDEAEVKAKISEQRMKRISDDKNGLFRRAYPAPTTQVMESKNNVNVPISLVEQLNDNLTFFRKLICGGTSAFTLNG